MKPKKPKTIILRGKVESVYQQNLLRETGEVSDEHMSLKSPELLKFAGRDVEVRITVK